MSTHSLVLASAVFAALMPMLPFGASADEPRRTFQLAMMDMMPMAGSASMPQSAPSGATMTGMGGRMDNNMMPMGGGAPMPGMGGRMDNNMMPMGGGAAMPGMGGGMPAQGQNQMPMGQVPQQMSGQQPMMNCPMMAMMQNMMRMGAVQPGMAQMQGAAGSGAAMGMDTMSGAMTTGMQQPGSSAARLEGRIAFLRTELRITDAQGPAWESFVAALRSGREHLDAARAALQDSSNAANPMTRLESYESHLKARIEAVHTTRMAYNTLSGQLDDAQKRVATTTMLPFIGSF